MEPHTTLPEPPDERPDLAEVVDQYLAHSDRPENEPKSSGQPASELSPSSVLDPETRAALGQFKAQLVGAEVSPPDTELSLQAVWARVHVRQQPVETRISSSVRTRSRILGVPGVLAVAAVIAAVFITGFPNSKNEQSALEPRRYTTIKGQQATIRLADGTSVLLGNASEVQISPSFNVNDREVTVTGEAYFTVTQNSGLPFTVRAGNAVTRVLGTEFAVRKYPEDTSVSIIVSSGKVSASAIATPSASRTTSDAVVLAAGDMASVNARGHLQIGRVRDMQVALAWTRGTVVFDNTPLREVIPVLERFYDLEISVSDSAVLHRKLTTVLTAGATQEAIQFLASILNVRAEQHGRQVTLHMRSDR